MCGILSLLAFGLHSQVKTDSIAHIQLSAEFLQNFLVDCITLHLCLTASQLLTDNIYSQTTACALLSVVTF